MSPRYKRLDVLPSGATWRENIGSLQMHSGIASRFLEAEQRKGALCAFAATRGFEKLCGLARYNARFLRILRGGINPQTRMSVS